MMPIDSCPEDLYVRRIQESQGQSLYRLQGFRLWIEAFEPGVRMLREGEYNMFPLLISVTPAKLLKLTCDTDVCNELLVCVQCFGSNCARRLRNKAVAVENSF